MLKKISALVLVVVMAFSLSSCKKPSDSKEYKLTIMTSIFPYYDVVKNVVADTPDVKISMAVAPGKDSHSFEPTPADIVAINEADVFIYNGGSMESWLEKVMESLSNDKQTQVCMMDSINQKELVATEENEEIFANLEEEEETDEVENDEHIWTSPVIMEEITDIVCETLSKELPDYADYFESNANEYKKQLESVDKDIRDTVKNAKYDTIIFADKFPLVYFTEEYDLDYYAAFPGCSSDMEPSAHTVAFLVDKIKNEKVKAVFCLELSNHMVADAISQDTGAQVLQFNSCHTVTQKQFESRVTYIDLMRENIDNLKIALN